MTDQLPADWGDPPWGARPGTSGASSGAGDSGPRTSTAPGTPPPPGPPRPGPAPPGPPPAQRPRPPQRPRTRERAIITFIAGFLLMVVAGIVVGLVLLGFWIVGSARGPIDATNEFVAALDEGRLDEAYASLCDGTRAEVTPEDFESQMEGASAITGYTFVSSAIRDGGETVVSGTVEVDGAPRAVDFGLRREDDEWTVCTYDPIPPRLN